MSPEGLARLLHDVRVHQVELDLRHEELRRQEAELEAVRLRYLETSRERYVALYDQAPVGYITLSFEGRILDVNQRAATLLGEARESLMKQDFLSFISPEDHRVYSRHRDALFKTGLPQQCEFRMLPRGADPFWAKLEATAGHEPDGTQVCRVVISDIAEFKAAAESARAMLSRHEAILAAVADLLMEVDADRVYTWANKAGLEFFGDDVVGKPACHYFVGEQATYRTVQPLFTGTKEVLYVESWQRRKDGVNRLLAWWCRSLKDKEGRVTGALSTAHDITEYREVLDREHLERSVLEVLNHPAKGANSLQDIVRLIRQRTGLEAVGVRLRDGNDFPYFAHEGFSDEFLAQENTLAVRTQDGDICKDEKGNPFLECTCGLVISGQTDPSNPLFTSGGSAWTNDAASLLEVPADKDPRLHPRNRCMHEGYASLALIPIRVNDEILGLLQLNDRRKNCFTIEMIRFLEGLSLSIGITVLRMRDEVALRQKMADLERFKKITVGRELQMIELKREINALLCEMGRPEKYRVV